MKTRNNNVELINKWLAWLTSPDHGFTSHQIGRAQELWDSVPVFFQGPPSAMAGEDKCLCLTWRTDPWTLSIEIDQEGLPSWFAYNTTDQQYFETEAEIRNLFVSQ